MANPVAVITGAGSGIGKAAALALMKEGWAVVFAGRRVDMLQQAAKEGSDSGSPSLVVQTDVTDPAQVRDLFAKTTEAFGRVDLLFNNAGMSGPRALLEEITPEQWQAVVNVNLNGSFYCTQEAFNVMKSQDPMGGRIINNGSISAHAPRPNSVAYTATKHAITGLTKSTSLDGRKYDIACGQIDIGNARTNFGGSRPAPDGTPPAPSPVASEANMDVEHVAQAIVYMASLPPEANVQFMTVMATKMPFVGRG
jgi:NAD(P)-dependent dehydrogenase (short-subunit alcohol dehydrogenase family)